MLTNCLGAFASTTNHAEQRAATNETSLPEKNNSDSEQAASFKGISTKRSLLHFNGSTETEKARFFSKRFFDDDERAKRVVDDYDTTASSLIGKAQILEQQFELFGTQFKQAEQTSTTRD